MAKKHCIQWVWLVVILVLILGGCFPFIHPYPRVERGKVLSIAEDPITLSKEFLQVLYNGMGIPLTAEYGIHAFAITYETIGLDRKASVESGLVILPVVEGNASRQNAPLPILSLQHGTIFSRDRSPSKFAMNLFVDNPEDYVGILFASLGYAVLMPDYTGLGVDERVLHPFCHAESIADSILDMIRAGQSILQEHAQMDWDERLFLVGYSEGGYATMAATKWIQAYYEQELTITGTAPMAGPYNLSGVMKSIITEDAHYAHLAFLAYLAFGYDVVYDLFDSVSEVFRPPYDSDLPPLMDGEHNQDAINKVLPGGGAGKPSALFTEAFIQKLLDPESTISTTLVSNDLHNTWIPLSPMLMVHSAGDEAVPVENSRTAVAFFNSQGFFPEYIELPDGQHVESYIPAYLVAIAWIQSLGAED